MAESLSGGSTGPEKHMNRTNHFATLDEMKRVIPAHCFESSYSTSVFYFTRDLLVSGALVSTAWLGIPYIPSIVGRYIAWMVYGYLQGLVFTGFWVQAHECGHGAFSPSQIFNDCVGLATHSALLVPYFGWKSTHRRHHTHANNLSKDHNYVPRLLEKDEHGQLFDPSHTGGVDDLTQDAPVAVLLRLVVHQVLGLYIYFATNMTASESSMYPTRSKHVLGNSHVLPTSTLFTKKEAPLILISDIGIMIMIFILYQAGLAYGFGTVALLYLQPWMWCNHWIVGITYLHHTDTELPKYREEDWTFVKGALSTMDRNRGWIGKHMFHNIADYHVIHHLFPRIPHYHTEEATKAILPLLDDQYHSTDERFTISLWDSFSRCRWVEAENNSRGGGKVCWYRSARTAER